MQGITLSQKGPDSSEVVKEGRDLGGAQSKLQCCRGGDCDWPPAVERCQTQYRRRVLQQASLDRGSSLLGVQHKGSSSCLWGSDLRTACLPESALWLHCLDCCSDGVCHMFE